ncbi:MFS transporter [Sphingomonas sp. ID0503]|uniref:MFS transporter n=1 Tax=Sphingomonas sp. ID0503 TaxID=3399691 RepID=UPI003AFAA6A8
MHSSLALLSKRRFLPLFATQFLGAFNDNLFKTAMVMLVTYAIYSDPAREATFSAIAAALFILPFFLLSALAGQLADWRDKAKLIRVVKTAEVVIMIAGAAGLLLSSIPLMLLALFAMGVHSTFFGPIKYAILPQHLREPEVLGGTGLVEAGTYIAILGGTIVGGLIHPEAAAAAVLGVALIGRITGQQVPDAPPVVASEKIDFHILRSSYRLIAATMHVTRLFRAIVAISFFWGMGAVLAAQFPPLVKNVLFADQTVATLFLAIFSVGVAIGSLAINRLLKGRVSARYAPWAALGMGAFLCDFYFALKGWTPLGEGLIGFREFVVRGDAERVMFDLLGVAFCGGMFVVPLYAFLTTTVDKSATARTVAANNIVNSGAMVTGTLLVVALMAAGLSVAETVLVVAAASIPAAVFAWRLHRACS